MARRGYNSVKIQCCVCYAVMVPVLSGCKIRDIVAVQQQRRFPIDVFQGSLVGVR